MARSRTLDLQKELHSNHLPSLVKCLPVSIGKPGPFGLPSSIKSEKVKRPCYRTKTETLEGCTVTGMPSFFNVMWDPRVRRGPSIKTFQQAEVDKCEAIKKAKNQTRPKKIKLKPRKLGGIAPYPPVVPERVPNPDYQKIWNQFLVEVFAKQLQEGGTQTDGHFLKIPCAKRPFCSGINVSTQIEDFDLFDKQEMMGLINDTIIQKISEQAISELMEEEEITALTKFENELHEKELVRASELVHVKEREQLELVEARKIENEALAEKKGEREMEEFVAQNCFSRAAVEAIKERLLAWLEKMGYPLDCVQLNIERQFIPWLNHMVLGETQLRGISGEILDDIMTAVTLRRGRDILDPLMETLQVDYFHKGKWMEDEEKSDEESDYLYYL